MRKMKIIEDVIWKEIILVGVIIDLGNVEDFKIGDWRIMRFVWYEDKCKQCLFCFYVCLDLLIKVENGKMVGVDYDYCKGCGVCIEVCLFKVFDFVEEKK